jgi:phosphate transport system substrate-binding protein
MTPPGKVTALLLFTVTVAGCGASPGASEEQSQVAVTGSSTIAPLMSEIGKRFERKHPGLRVDVQTGGSSRGVADVRGGLADIGMVSRDLKPDESDLHGFPIARDGVCIILHATNPVPRLTAEQIVSIYTKKTESWKDVGGPDAPITVVNKAEGRSTLEVFTTHFRLTPQDIKADVVIGDNEQGVKTVAGNPNAIGYVSIGTAEFDRDAGVPIQLLPLDGVEPSVQTVADGTFPMSRTLNLVTKKPPQGRVREFIEFARSREVHDLVRDLSFVPRESRDGP